MRKPWNPPARLRQDIGIGVFGHYGQSNLGDESLTAAVTVNIARLAPGAKITGFSLNPADTTERHGIPAVAIRARLPTLPTAKPQPDVAGAGGNGYGWLRQLRVRVRRVAWLRATYNAISSLPSKFMSVVREVGFVGHMWRALGCVDVLVFAGSNQMIDYFGGPWEFPFTLFKWAAIAGLRGVKVAFVSVGAGPLDGRLARRFVRWSLRSAAFVSVRDGGSRRIVQELGYEHDVQVFPDLAFSLPYQPRAARLRPEGPRIVAINPMPLFDGRYWPTVDSARYNSYVHALSGLCRGLAVNGDHVILFGTQPADEWVADDIIEQIDAAGPRVGQIELRRPRSVDEVLEVIAGSDLVVATRFHGILLSLLAGTPVVGICYYRKSRELMESAGVGEFALGVEQVEEAVLAAKLGELDARRDEIVLEVRRAVDENRAHLESQYQTILALATAGKT